MDFLEGFLERFFPFNRSKREALKTAATITAGGLIVVGGIAGWEKLYNFVEQLGLTDDQKKAHIEFLKTLPELRAYNLQAVEEDGVDPILRDKPNSTVGKVLGQIKSGTIIPEAIVVPGNDRNYPTDPIRQVNWYYIPVKDSRGNYHYGGFTNGDNLVKQNIPAATASK